MGGVRTVLVGGTCTSGAFSPEPVGPLVDAVDIVVSQPAGLSKEHAEQEDRQRARVGEVRVAEVRCGEAARGPNSEELHLVDNVAFPPTVSDELSPQLPEVLRGFGVGLNLILQHEGGGVVALGKPLVHVPSLLAVERVHHLRGVSAVIPVDPMSAGGMSLPPTLEVVPLVVDANVEGSTAGYIVAGLSHYTVTLRSAVVGSGRSSWL